MASVETQHRVRVSETEWTEWIALYPTPYSDGRVSLLVGTGFFEVRVRSTNSSGQVSDWGDTLEADNSDNPWANV